MRRLLLTGDWHLAENPRDAYRYGAVEQIRQLLRKHKVNDLFILGDLTDYAGGHSDLFVNRVVDLLASIATECCVHIIRGNHDASDPSVPFFRFINAIPDCRYITEVTVWEAAGHRILLVPNGMFPQPLLDGFGSVFAHETFGGAVAEHGIKLTGLRLPMAETPIFSGDVHVPQRQGTVTYVGAPTAIRFGDTYKPRVLLMDLNAGCEPVVKSMPIAGPTKKLVGVAADADGALLWADFDKVNKGDIVKVRVAFTGEIPSLAHLRADIAEGIAGKGATLYGIDVAGKPGSAPVPHKPVSRSDADLVRQYGKARGLPQPVIKAGLAIVKGERP